MRYLAFAALAIILSSFYAAGQEAGWDIGVGISYSSYSRSYVTDPGRGFRKNADILWGESESTYTVDGRTVSYARNTVVLPTLAITAGRHLKDLPLNIRLGLYINHAYNTLNGGPAPLSERETIVALMPALRCYYVEKPSYRLFANIEAGLSTSIYSESLNGDTTGSAQCAFAWQISPIGMEIGRKWYFSFAFGIGRVWDFALFNLGYRFGKSPR